MNEAYELNVVNEWIDKAVGKWQRQQDGSIMVEIPQVVVDAVTQWVAVVWEKRKGKRLWRNDNEDYTRHVAGTLGEIAACVILSKTEYSNEVLHPDWSIFESNTAYRDSDIGNYSVKTCRMRSDWSWIAEKGDCITRKSCGQPIVLMRADGFIRMYMLGVWLPRDLYPYWREPFARHLKDGKAALYYSDIKNVQKYHPEV